jgi:hypothetical protein
VAAVLAFGLIWAENVRQSEEPRGPGDPVGRIARSATVIITGRSRCSVNTAARIVTFRVAVYNPTKLGRSPTVRPVIRLASGGFISRARDDQSLFVGAQRRRDLVMSVGYGARERPRRCVVTLIDGKPEGAYLLPKTAGLA